MVEQLRIFPFFISFFIPDFLQINYSYNLFILFAVSVIKRRDGQGSNNGDNKNQAFFSPSGKAGN